MFTLKPQNLKTAQPYNRKYDSTIHGRDWLLYVIQLIGGLTRFALQKATFSDAKGRISQYKRGHLAYKPKA